jgi:hypothetical protein
LLYFRYCPGASKTKNKENKSLFSLFTFPGAQQDGIYRFFIYLELQKENKENKEINLYFLYCFHPAGHLEK